MSKSIIGEELRAEMTEVQNAEGRSGGAMPENISEWTGLRLPDEMSERSHLPTTSREVPRTKKAKTRFGLPAGFTPRLQRNGRSVLLEDNVYRLPNGQEFIPQNPTGTLGKLRHLYALLTAVQYAGAKRGSVYVRTDGRIFDYGVDHGDPAREMFDTGYTIHDLERTGRYAGEACCPEKEPPKRRNAARAG